MNDAGYDAAAMLADVKFLVDRWGDLLELRQPGTPRPWRQALLDPERKAAQAARDRDERSVRDPDAPGFTSAPQHIEILDVIVEGWVTLDELADAVRPHGPLPANDAAWRARVTDIDGARWVVETWLEAAADSPAVNHDRIARIARRLARLVVEVARAIGLVLAGQLLAGAVCPFCAGTTPKHPEGGAVTLRVEEIARAKDATDLRPAVEAVHAVVCWNPLCDPDTEHCGTRYRGRPAWPWHEWEWLAPQLIVADPVRSVPPPSVPADFTKLPVDHSGRAGVDRGLNVAAAAPASLSGLLEREAPPDRGLRVTFRGGPFDRQVRSFVTHSAVLAVVQPDGLRPQLASAATATLERVAQAFGHPEIGITLRVIGAYRYVAEPNQPHYEWHSRGERTGLSA